MMAKISVRVSLIGAVLLSAACGKVDEPSKGSAPKNNASGPIVSKWKTQNASTSKAPMGLVLEQQDEKITATLYEFHAAPVGDPGLQPLQRVHLSPRPGNRGFTLFPRFPTCARRRLSWLENHQRLGSASRPKNSRLPERVSRMKKMKG